MTTFLRTRHFGTLAALSGLLVGLAGGSPAALAQVTAAACGPLQNAIGPWDYRSERGHPLEIVERVHFTPMMETNPNSHAAKDLDYTLRAFPNHHRALLAVDRYGQRTKSAQPPGLPRPVECYYERAVRWRPDDAVVRMLYAQYLYRNERAPEARQHLESAVAGAGDNVLTLYNAGLVYAEGKDYAPALALAHRAQAMGMQRLELRQKLETAGQWREPPAQ